jgi:uncharacterized protein
MSEQDATAPPQPDARRRKKELAYKFITVPGNMEQACSEFNAERFFECHESIEEIWQQETGDVRDLYKGLIQVAAAFVHISRANFIGANRLCSTALRYLHPYRQTGAMGFDVETICLATEDAHRRVLELGRGHLAEFDIAQRPFYTFDRAAMASDARRWSAWGFDGEGNAIETEIVVAE